jgi:hypothetical protein
MGYPFAVDAAASAESALCPQWYGPGSPDGEDALAVPAWLSPAWVNPPYLKGKAWTAWLDKFVGQSRSGVEIVALLPAHTGTQWWFDYVTKPAADVLFLVGRVPFIIPGREKPSQPNHDSAIVCYAPNSTGRVVWWDWKRELEYERQRLAEPADATIDAELVDAE